MQLFCDDQRLRIRSENPNDGIAAINSKLAAAWKEASEEEKAKYIKQHQVSVFLFRAQGLMNRSVCEQHCKPSSQKQESSMQEAIMCNAGAQSQLGNYGEARCPGLCQRSTFS